MCAIIGWAGKITPQLLRDLVRAAEPRGPHSAGLAFDEGSGPNGRFVPRPKLNVLKRAVTPTFFLRRHYHRVRRAAGFELGFAHVRWATHGDIIDANAHPFTFHAVGGADSPANTHHEHLADRTFVFCHNGVVRNYLDFAPTAVVDSECFGPLLARRNPGLARGSIGLCWFEETAGPGVDEHRGGNRNPERKMFVYRRNQNLSATTFGRNGQVFTIIASLQTLIPKYLLSLPHFTTHLAEGTAYEVLPGGLNPVWTDNGPETGAWSSPAPLAQPVRAVIDDDGDGDSCAARIAEYAGG